jgi:hypothetical protein
VGGVLAGGDATQPALRQLSVTLNLAAGDRSSQPFEREPAAATGSKTEPGEGDDSRELAAIRGPGGFPLLEATALGDWRRTPRPVLVASGEEPAPATTPSPPVAAAANVSTNVEEDTVAAATAPRVSLWGQSRVTLSFGLSIATFLTLNVILSDPVAGFDYLATCLDSEDSEATHQAAQARRTSMSQRGNRSGRAGRQAADAKATRARSLG